MTISGRIAILAPGKDELEIRDIPFNDPTPFQVVIEQYASGICHTQLHQIHSQRTDPALLGHESTGRVAAVGSAVTSVQVGDLVLVTWLPKSSRVSRAPEAASLALADGTLAMSQNVFTWGSHTIADEQYVVRAPEGMPLDTGSILGCAVVTGAGAVLHSAGVDSRHSVSVWGVGGIGLCAIVAARNVGASPVIAVDIDDDKLAMAREFGATLTVNAKSVDPVAEVRRLSPGTSNGDVGGVDFAFDCVGGDATTQQALASVRSGYWSKTRGGRAFLVGVPPRSLSIEGVDLLVGEKSLVGSLGGSYASDPELPLDSVFSLFVDWYKNGKLELDKLVTARYRLDDINQACADLEGGKIGGRAILDFAF